MKAVWKQRQNSESNKGTEKQLKAVKAECVTQEGAQAESVKAEWVTKEGAEAEAVKAAW